MSQIFGSIFSEWAAGAARIAETWPERPRAKAAGIIQSADAVGFFRRRSRPGLSPGSYRSLFCPGNQRSNPPGLAKEIKKPFYIFLSSFNNERSAL